MGSVHVIVSSVVLVASVVLAIVSTKGLRETIKDIYHNPKTYLD